MTLKNSLGRFQPATPHHQIYALSQQTNEQALISSSHIFLFKHGFSIHPIKIGGACRDDEVLESCLTQISRIIFFNAEEESWWFPRGKNFHSDRIILSLYSNYSKFFQDSDGVDSFLIWAVVSSEKNVDQWNPNIGICMESKRFPGSSKLTVSKPGWIYT